MKTVTVHNPLKQHLNRYENPVSIKELYFLLNMTIAKSTLYAISTGLHENIHRATAEKLDMALGLPSGHFEKLYFTYRLELCKAAKEKCVL
jgi:hypothetical protein